LVTQESHPRYMGIEVSQSPFGRGLEDKSPVHANNGMVALGMTVEALEITRDNLSKFLDLGRDLDGYRVCTRRPWCVDRSGCS